MMPHSTQKNLISQLIPWVMWGLGATAFFIEYLIRVAPAAMVPSLMESFSATSLDISAFAAFFLYAYVFMQIPVGLLVDRFGARVCLGLSTAICAVSTLIFASTQDLFTAQVSRLLLGFGAAFALVGTLKLALVWFKPGSFSIIVGLTQTLGMIGGATGVCVMGRLAELEDWRISIHLFGEVLAVLAVLILLFVRNGSTTHLTANTTLPLQQSFALVFKKPETWLIAIFTGLLYMPTAVIAELWGGYYLMNTQEIPATVANDGISIIFLGWAIGGPLSGFVSNRVGRKPIMIGSAFTSLLLIVSILYLPPMPIPLLYGLLFTYGLCNSGMVAAYTAIAELSPPAVAGIALGFVNGMSVIIGAFCQQAVGALIDWLHSQRYPVRIDIGPEELKLAMVIVVIGIALGFIASLFTQETLRKHA